LKKRLRAISVRDILAMIGWATTITLMTIIAEYVKPLPIGSTATSFDTLDLAIFLAASLGFGMFLVDPEKILYGFIGATFLSTAMSVIYSGLYDLYVLGLGEYFFEAAPGWEWEWVAWFAFLRIFRLMFPVAIILVFAGGMIGGIVSDWIWPHRG